ncbi:hypothetical protein Dsin_028734 [Dipteronia sinensis]|uniref:Uncharacterized protein n=1 Tax=Dipteronia sinensis TaxID=43782 RepID=A0AAE0DUJ2_9ROSI|nr:hypothetical protein Dsin_028734 [Dipteronia sinensis]
MDNQVTISATKNESEKQESTIKVNSWLKTPEKALIFAKVPRKFRLQRNLTFTNFKSSSQLNRETKKRKRMDIVYQNIEKSAQKSHSNYIQNPCLKNEKWKKYSINFKGMQNAIETKPF